MDVLNAIFGYLSQVPWWGWVILVFGLLFLFGDRGLWDLEVKFPLTDGVGRGEVEFEGWTKRGHILEAKFMFEPGFAFDQIDILLDGVSVARIPKERAKGRRLFFSEKIELGRPEEGQMVTVEIDGREVFSGALVRD